MTVMLRFPASLLSFTSALLLFAAPACKKAERRDAPAAATPAAAPANPSGPAPAAAPSKPAPPISDQAIAKGELPPGHPPIGAVPPNHPPMGAAPGAPGTIPPPAPSTGKAVTWTVPAAWKARPPRTAMRKAELVLPGKTSADDAELIVFHFPGTGGSVDANIERWYAQFQSPTDKKSTKRTVNGLNVTVATCTGTLQKPKDPTKMNGPTEAAPNSGMWAAIVETPEGPWFFKALGPKATLDAQGASFEAFVGSFKR